MPCVSIIVPTYNRAHLVRETIDSIAKQPFRDWECIIIDDGSTDNTASVVEEYLNRDKRFRYYHQKNSSASNARNYGVSVATGELLVFLDSDDLIPQDRLEWQTATMMQNHEAVLVYGDTFHFRNGNISDGYYYQEWLKNKPTGNAFEALLNSSSIYSPMVRAKAIREAGGFDTTLGSAEDWDMWLRISRIGRVIYVPRLALYYRLHEGNKSGRTLWNYSCARRVFDKHLAFAPPHRRAHLRIGVRRYFRRGYGPKLYDEACEATLRHDWPNARRLWRALVHLDPHVLRKRAALVNYIWAIAPVNREPFWRSSKAGVCR